MIPYGQEKNGGCADQNGRKESERCDLTHK
jgi:hypothetical protein